MRKSIFKNQRGFSLIELMVVVVIIGLLAALAVPNFRQFQRRAVQTEAKTLMSGVYTAQVSFSSEHGSASPNIDQIGFSPEGEIQYRVGFSNAVPTHGTTNVNLTNRPSGYKGPPARNVGDIDTIHLCNSGRGSRCSLASGVTTNSFPWTGFTSKTCQPASGHTGCTATTQADCGDSSGASGCKNGTADVAGVWAAGAVVNNSQRFNPTFSIGAASDIGGGQIDEWTMSNGKEITNTQDGTQ